MSRATPPFGGSAGRHAALRIVLIGLVWSVAAARVAVVAGRPVSDQGAIRVRAPEPLLAPGPVRPLLVPPVPGPRPEAGTPGARLDRVVADLRRGPDPSPAAEVDRWTVRLATQRAGGMHRMLSRMARYEPLIRGALAQHSVPQDLIYLALIESGFDPGATSRAGAAGIWQIMPATARELGLEVSRYVDERRDPIRSTYAAARYLAWLHREFGSWHLAIAAYNGGSGRLARTLERQGSGARGDDRLFWIIRDRLPRETQDYLPQLLAAARIGHDPPGFGIEPTGREPPLRFREVWAPGGTPLARIAGRTGTDLAEIRSLNPHLIRDATPPGRRWPMRLPAASRDLRRVISAPRPLSSR